MNVDQVLAFAAPKRVLFMGETITDVYNYGRALGRPMKETIPCIQSEDFEVFNGGVLAAATHARTFCATTHIYSTTQLVKTRWLERAYYRKLFETYSGWQKIDRHDLSEVSDYDIVIVTDYGHGMFNDALIERVCESAKFLALNVQTNAGNYGFNLATKWPRADFLCVDELEARLATQNQSGPIEESLQMLAMAASRVVITLGKRGCIGLDGTGTHTVEAFPGDVIDTMGAGDALFVLAALIVQDVDLPVAMRIGNAAGKLQAQTVGHRSAVTKTRLTRFLNGTA